MADWRAVQAIIGAAEEGDAEGVARMLEEDPRLLMLSDEDGLTPLTRAAGRGHVGIVRLLIERGVDVNAIYFKYGDGPQIRDGALICAAHNGHEEVVSILLASGADINRRGFIGMTVLMIASRRGDVAVARLLMRAMGACGLDERDDRRCTALWYAASSGHVDVVRALLLAGADPTIYGRDGCTPQQTAQRFKHPQCVALLQWWEDEVQRPYVLHKARALHDDTATRQHAPAAAVPAYLSPRVQGGSIMPSVQVRDWSRKARHPVASWDDLVSSPAEKPPSQTTQDGHMTPFQECLGTLLECMRSWEGPEDAASCAGRFLACVAEAEQEEQLRRLLSFVEAVRGGLVERLEGREGSSGVEGSMEEASRKRARCDAAREDKNGPGEPQGQEARREAGPKDEARPSTSPSLCGKAKGTAGGAAPEAEAAAAGVAVHEGMCVAGKGVLLDGDLLGCVWGYVLGGTGRQDVCVLGQLSVVCRKWREASLREVWWGGAAQDMLPLLWEEETEGKAASSRGRVVQYGRFLKGQRELLKEPEWGEDRLKTLEGHMEVFDRMDGLQLFSMRGPVSFTEEWGCVVLLFNSLGRQSKSTAFCAASRDPLDRFADVWEYLVEGHEEEYPSCLCIRMTLRDMRTGRVAVVWEENKCEAEVEREPFEDNWSQVKLKACEGTYQKAPFGRLVRPFMAFFDLRQVGRMSSRYPSDRDVPYLIEPSQDDFAATFVCLSGDEDEELTLEHFRGALQAVMVSGSMKN